VPRRGRKPTKAQRLEQSEQDRTASRQQTPLIEPSKFPVREYTNQWTERYDTYISSSRWDRRRARYYGSHTKACRACGSTEDIHLHHHTYKRLGKEHDDDLVPLCQAHHAEVHQLHRGSEATLTEVTRQVVQLHGGVFEARKRRHSSQAKIQAKRNPVAVQRHVLKARKKRPPIVVPTPRRPKLSPLTVGDQVLLVGQEKLSRQLSWAAGKSGVVLEELSSMTWSVELSSRPGSRLAVTRHMVELKAVSDMA
jgi:hypothetical protein